MFPIILRGENMNWTDIVVIVILVFSTLVAHKVGFIRTCVNFFSTIISLILAYTLYPNVSTFLRDKGLLNTISNSIKSTLNIKDAVSQMTLNAQTDFINNLELPKFLKSALIENNNSEVYNLFNVSQVEDYIVSYISNMCINVISMIVTFLLVLIIIKVVAEVLDLVSKLPVLNFANKTLGAALGFVKGMIIIWILCIVVTLFYSNPTFHSVIVAVDNSLIAKIFYNNNWLMFMVTKIFT